MLNRCLQHSVLSLVMLVSVASLSYAHFPWLVRTEDGKAALFFGEGLNDRTYRMPPSIAKAEVQIQGKSGPTALDMKPIESEALVGIVSDEPVPADAIMHTNVTFGIYQGARLDYYASHVAGELPKQRPASGNPNSPAGLAAQLVQAAESVQVYVTWQGKPLSNAEVKLFCSEGHEEANATTNDDGMVAFDQKDVEPGLNAIMVGHKETVAGKVGDKEYDKASHYLTVTFEGPEAGDSKEDVAMQQGPAALAPLPFAITSFGAARLGDDLYVYGGHTGEAHQYANDSQSNKLLRLSLTDSAAGWQEVAEGERLQGFGMVAHGDKLIVIGGFKAMNQPGEEHDLHSQSDVHVFDTQSKTWSTMAPLPEPRSSHDAVLVGDTIYVVAVGLCKAKARQRGILRPGQ